MLSIPLIHWAVRSIVILITDVTPLTVDPKRRRRTQVKVRSFAHAGGIVILGHDCLYRRTKNIIFQEMAGGEITGFKKVEGPILYLKNTQSTRYISDPKLDALLPKSLIINDKELLTGRWLDDVDFIYIADEPAAHPLVTQRNYGHGTVFWINSGDTDSSGPAPSIAKPERDLITLLSSLLLLS